MVLEIEEQEIKDILDVLIKEKTVVNNNNKYFFNIKKSIKKDKKNNSLLIDDVKSIVIEKEEGYDNFLALSDEAQTRIRSYVDLLNFVNKAGGKNLKNLVELYNQTSGNKSISLCTLTRIKSKYKRYGFRGILPAYSTDHIESSIPDELFSYFKKYYLTNEKLSAAEDILIPLSKELGVSQLYPSDMQHNFVNMCLKQNIPLTFIQKSLGIYGIVNFIKTYKSLIENLEEAHYNPLDKILRK